MIPRYSRPEAENIWSQQRKFEIWLDIEIAVCEALNRIGIVPDKDLKVIKEKAKFDISRIDELEKKLKHDVIAFLANLSENIGPSSRYIHMGMTSSDILDTCLAIQMRDSCDLLIEDVKKLKRQIAIKAKKYKYTPMIGRTHGVHAEPITFGFKMAVMYDEFCRVENRLKAARELVRVGKISGAVGTNAHISPEVESYVCKKFGLKPAAISTQIISRDIHAEFISTLALVATSCEKWAQEFRHLQRTEVHEVEEFFAEGQKGSSAMPHKKNPITAEKICGLSRVIRGNLIAALENVALWHERDISHSSAERIILPDSVIALDHILVCMEELVSSLRVFPEQMKKNLDLTKGLIFSQQLMLKLIDRGMDRQKAYSALQRNSLLCWEKGISFDELVKNDPEINAVLSKEEIDEIFDIKRHFRWIDFRFRKLGLK